MFTGIVEATGEIVQLTPMQQGVRMLVRASSLDFSDVRIGDSIAVDGVCLTVIERGDQTFASDVSQETLACTAGFRTGAEVNLEKALRLSDRLGGHLVSGHVDGRGHVLRLEPVGESWLLEIRADAGLERYIARTGSICVNGVSLTVNAVRDRDFTVNLIPHTMQVTNFRALRTGSAVNLEADLVARYVERLLTSSNEVR